MENKAKLYQKICNVMSAIVYLQKDDKIEFGNTKYRAISEEKTTTAIRAELIKNKIAIIPVSIDLVEIIQKEKTDRDKSSMYITTIKTSYLVCDSETGYSEKTMSAGSGADSQDKGIAKALTMAYKYLLLRMFSIPTGDDPDHISSEEIDYNNSVQPPKSPGKKEKTPKQLMLDTLKRWYDDLDCIEYKDSIKALGDDIIAGRCGQKEFTDMVRNLKIVCKDDKNG